MVSDRVEPGATTSERGRWLDRLQVRLDGGRGARGAVSVSPATRWSAGPVADAPVFEMHGHEAVNSSFCFDAIWEAPASLDDPRTLLGQPAVLALGAGGRRRRRCGVVTSVEPLPDIAFHTRTVLAQLRPRLWLLTQTLQSRVFVDVSIPEIVQRVLDDHGVSVAFNLGKSGHENRRDHTVQYRESDYDFVTRLLAELGGVFFFEHLAPSSEHPWGYERVRVVDDAAGYAPLRGQDVDLGSWLPYAPGAGLALPPERIERLTSRAAVAPSAAARRHFDFQRAAPAPGKANPLPDGTSSVVENGAVSVRRSVGHEGKVLETYTHRATHVDGVHPASEVLRDLEAARRASYMHRGRGVCVDLMPGSVFTVELPRRDSTIEVAVTSCTYRLEGDATGSGEDEMTLFTSFEGVDADVLSRPAPPEPRRVQALETATVVTAAGHASHCDPYGRVRIQFHWDREGKNDDQSSAWVRVAQPWSGSRFGFQFIPRAGQEVVIGFLDGDPDHPIIVGSVPNLANPLPFPLPGRADVSAIRSSTPSVDGAFNEIRFEDAEQAQVLGLVAHRDLRVDAGQDYQLTVARSWQSAVGTTRQVTVGKPQAPGLDQRVVFGAQHHDVFGPHRDHVREGRRLVTEGGYEHAVVGPYRQEVRGNLLLQVERPPGSDPDLDPALDPRGTISVAGHLSLAGERGITLNSDERIELRVGSSQILITSDGIELSADTITVRAEEHLSTRGATATHEAEERVMVQSEEVWLRSERPSGRSSLVLDDNASLDGALVLLNCGGVGPPDPASDTPARGDISFVIEPPPGMTGELDCRFRMPTGRIVEHRTESHRVVFRDLPDGAEVELLEASIGGIPVPITPLKSPGETTS